MPFVMAGAGDTTKSCAKQSFARGVGCGFAPRAQNGGVQPPSKHAPRVACDLRLGSESSAADTFRISIDPFSIFLRVEGFELPKTHFFMN